MAVSSAAVLRLSANPVKYMEMVEISISEFQELQAQANTSRILRNLLVEKSEDVQRYQEKSGEYRDMYKRAQAHLDSLIFQSATGQPIKRMDPRNMTGFSTNQPIPTVDSTEIPPPVVCDNDEGDVRDARFDHSSSSPGLNLSAEGKSSEYKVNGEREELSADSLTESTGGTRIGGTETGGTGTGSGQTYGEFSQNTNASQMASAASMSECGGDGREGGGLSVEPVCVPLNLPAEDSIGSVGDLSRYVTPGDDNLVSRSTIDSDLDASDLDSLQASSSHNLGKLNCPRGGTGGKGAISNRRSSVPGDGKVFEGSSSQVEKTIPLQPPVTHNLTESPRCGVPPTSQPLATKPEFIMSNCDLKSDKDDVNPSTSMWLQNEAETENILFYTEVPEFDEQVGLASSPAPTGSKPLAQMGNRHHLNDHPTASNIEQPQGEAQVSTLSPGHDEGDGLHGSASLPLHDTIGGDMVNSWGGAHSLPDISSLVLTNLVKENSLLKKAVASGGGGGGSDSALTVLMTERGDEKTHMYKLELANKQKRIDELTQYISTHFRGDMRELVQYLTVKESEINRMQREIKQNRRLNDNLVGTIIMREREGQASTPPHIVCQGHEQTIQSHEQTIQGHTETIQGHTETIYALQDELARMEEGKQKLESETGGLRQKLKESEKARKGLNKDLHEHIVAFKKMMTQLRTEKDVLASTLKVKQTNESEISEPFASATTVSILGSVIKKHSTSQHSLPTMDRKVVKGSSREASSLSGSSPGRHHDKRSADLQSSGLDSFGGLGFSEQREVYVEENEPLQQVARYASWQQQQPQQHLYEPQKQQQHEQQPTRLGLRIPNARDPILSTQYHRSSSPQLLSPPSQGQRQRHSQQHEQWTVSGDSYHHHGDHHQRPPSKDPQQWPESPEDSSLRLTQDDLSSQSTGLDPQKDPLALLFDSTGSSSLSEIPQGHNVLHGDPKYSPHPMYTSLSPENRIGRAGSLPPAAAPSGPSSYPHLTGPTDQQHGSHGSNQSPRFGLVSPGRESSPLYVRSTGSDQRSAGHISNIQSHRLSSTGQGMAVPSYRGPQQSGGRIDRSGGGYGTGGRIDRSGVGYGTGGELSALYGGVNQSHPQGQVQPGEQCPGCNHFFSCSDYIQHMGVCVHIK